MSAAVTAQGTSQVVSSASGITGSSRGGNFAGGGRHSAGLAQFAVGRVKGGLFASRVEGFEEADERFDFGRGEVFAEGGHIAAAGEDLEAHLVGIHAGGDGV